MIEYEKGVKLWSNANHKNPPKDWKNSMEQNFNIPFKNQSLQRYVVKSKNLFTKGTKKYLRRYVNNRKRQYN